MSSPIDAFRAIKRKRTQNPRTILAFYATVIALGLAASVGAATTILVTGTALDLLPWVLSFGGVVFLLVVGGVFWISIKDPSKLMLGQVTGEEYAEIQRVTLGDSSTGERQTEIIVSEALPVEISEGATLQEEGGE